MPTGYTHSVAEGTCSGFKEFAYRCARAMGGTMFMRDEPFDARIPDKMPPQSTYHADRLVEAKDKLNKLRAMNTTDRGAAYKEWWEETITKHLERCEAIAAQRQRYEDMLDIAEDYNDGPEGLQSFMIDQLKQSIDFDCRMPDDPIDPGPQEWYTRAVKDAEWAVQYHRDQISKDDVRTLQFDGWLAKLHESLKDY